MALLLIPPRIRFVDDDGLPLVGGKVYTYEAGTSTPKDTYQDEAATVLNANPVILDARGEALIRLAGSYKINVTDANDVQLSDYPVDNITEFDMRDWSGLTATIADLNSTTTTAINKSTDYSIIATDRGKTILADSSAAKVTITLLPAATATNRYRITIKKVNISDSTKPVEILGDGSETIDGVNSLKLYDINDYLEVLCDGSNWRIVSGQIRGATLPITTATTITFDDHSKTYLCDASGGAFDFTLLPSSTVGDGFQIKIKKIDSSANAITVKPDGSETIDGESSFELKKQYDFVWLINDGNNWYAIGEYATGTEGDLPLNYIAGFYTTPDDGGDPQHDIIIGTGACRDAANALDIRLSSALTKRIDANWAAGTGNGGFPIGLSLKVNTWYYEFVIVKPDGTVDGGYDEAINASNLLADAIDYTGYRRVGSVLTDSSSNITHYRQSSLNRNYFYWDERVKDIDDTNPGTSIVNRGLTVPSDIEVYAMIAVKLTYSLISPGSAEINIIREGADEDTVGSQLTATHVSSTSIPGHGQIHILTNTSRQIKYMLTASIADTRVEVWTHGWIDTRGAN